jgi:hypothetical protein
MLTDESHGPPLNLGQPITNNFTSRLRCQKKIIVYNIETSDKHVTQPRPPAVNRF